MAASTTILSRTQNLLNKLSHPLSEVRNRALENIHFKLTNGLLTKSDIIQDRNAMKALIDWVNRTAASEPRDDVNDENRAYEGKNGPVKTAESFPMYALQLLNTLSREKVSGQYLLSNGAVESLQTLRKSVDCPDHFHDIIDEIIGALLARPLVGDTMNAKVPGEVSLEPGDFRDSASETIGLVNKIQLKGLAWQEDGAIIGSMPKSKMARPLSLKGGWRFPTISLIRSDESALFDLQAQLRVAEDHNITKACKTISNFVAQDFPPELFLQRPDLLHGLLGQVSLPGMTDGEANTSSRDTDDPALAAARALDTLVARLHARLRVYLDSDAYTPDSLASSKSFSRGLDPGMQQIDILNDIKTNNTTSVGEPLAMSLGYAAMVIFISCLPALKTHISFPVRKLLLDVVSLIPERFPYVQQNSKGFGTVVTNDTLNCARIERCVEALNRVVSSDLLQFLTAFEKRQNTDLELVSDTVTGHLCDLRIMLNLLRLAGANSLAVANTANDTQQNRLRSATVYVPAEVISIMKLFVYNERLSSSQPDILEVMLPILEVLDPVSFQEHLHGQNVIAIINRMKTTLEIDEGVIESLYHNEGNSDERDDMSDLVNAMNSGATISEKNIYLQDRLEFLEDCVTALQYSFGSMNNIRMVVAQVIGLCIGLGRDTHVEDVLKNWEMEFTNESEKHRQCLGLLLKLLSHPRREIQSEAYSQVSVALDGNLMLAANTAIGGPKLMWKMLFCVALNPEVLYEAFAHGMMSKDDAVQTSATGFVRNVLAKAMNRPSLATRALAPFQVYLQAFAYKDCRINSNDTSAYSGSKRNVQSMLPEAVALLGLFAAGQSKSLMSLHIIRKLMHSEKWVRHTASIEIRDFLRDSNRFINTQEESFKHGDNRHEDPVSIFADSRDFVSSIDFLQDGFSAASVAFAVDDVSRFAALLSNLSTQGEVWKSGAIQCASMLCDKRVVEGCVEKNVDILVSLCKVCLRRLEKNNEIEHFAALQVLYACVAQCQEICNILFLSNAFGKDEADPAMRNISVLSAFIFHKSNSFVAITLSIFTLLCFRPTDIFCYTLRTRKNSAREVQNVKSLAKAIELKHRKPDTDVREGKTLFSGLGKSSLVLTQLEPFDIPRNINFFFDLDKMSDLLNMRVFDFSSVNATSHNWKLGYDPSPKIQNMVTAAVQRLIVADKSSDEIRKPASAITCTVNLLEDINSTSSHRSCTRALEKFYYNCEINKYLLDNASRATWYETFRRFLETAPSSRKDEFLLSKVVKCISKLCSSMNKSAKVMALIALRDRLIPLLAVYLQRSNHGNHLAKKAKLKIPGVMIEMLRGTSYGLPKTFLEGIKNTNSSYNTTERQALVTSILELTLSLCSSGHNTSFVDEKTNEEIKYSLLFETNLMSILINHIALCNHRDLSTVRISLTILNGMISGINGNSKELTNLAPLLETAMSMVVQIAQVHRIPNSHIGRAVFREAIVAIEQLVPLGFSVGEDIVWCKRLLMDREIYVRVCGYNIIAHLLSKHYDDESILTMLTKEATEDSIPQLVQQSWACAMDRKEPFAVRSSAMHVVRAYFVFACMTSSLQSVEINIEKNLGLQSFVSLSVLPGLSEVLSQEALSSCTFSNAIAQLLVTADGAFSMLEGLDEEWLAGRLYEYDLWQPLLEMMNPRMHWDGYISNVERNYTNAAKSGYATITIPSDIEASFHKHGYVFKKTKKFGSQTSRNIDSNIAESTLNDIYLVWRTLYSEVSTACGGLVMHLAKRSLQIHSGYSQNQLENMSPLITSTLEHFFAFSRKYIVLNNSLEAVYVSTSDEFTLVQTILTLVNEISKGAKCPVDNNNGSSSVSLSLIEQFEKSLEFCLGPESPDRLRFASAVLLSSVATSKEWAPMLSDPYVGKRPTLNNQHDIDVDSLTAITIPGGSSLVKALIEFYLDKHSTVDLGFNDGLSAYSHQSEYPSLFVSWEHNVPLSQQGNIALAYGIRAMLERSVYFKEECIRSGMFDFVLNRIDELHDLLVLEGMGSEFKGKSSKTLQSRRELVLNAQVMSCLGIYESIIYRSPNANTYACKHGGLRIVTKTLTYADAREAATSFLGPNCLLDKVLSVLLNVLSNGENLVKHVFGGSAMQRAKNRSRVGGTSHGHFKKIIQKVGELGIFFGNYVAPDPDDNAKIWELMRICYGIVSNAAVSTPKILKLVSRSGFLDKNCELLEKIVRKNGIMVNSTSSRSASPTSTPRSSRPTSPADFNSSDTSGVIFVSSSGSFQHSKKQVAVDKNRRFENVINTLIRISTTKYGCELIGRHKQTVDCILKRAFEKPKSMLLMRNIAFHRANKSYFTSNPVVMNKIVNKLVDDRSVKELQSATYAAACMYSVISNNEKGKAILKHADIQGKIAQARRRTEESIQFGRDKQWQHYRLSCLKAITL